MKFTRTLTAISVLMLSGSIEGWTSINAQKTKDRIKQQQEASKQQGQQQGRQQGSNLEKIKIKTVIDAIANEINLLANHDLIPKVNAPVTNLDNVVNEIKKAINERMIDSRTAAQNSTRDKLHSIISQHPGVVDPAPGAPRPNGPGGTVYKFPDHIYTFQNLKDAIDEVERYVGQIPNDFGNHSSKLLNAINFNPQQSFADISQNVVGALLHAENHGDANAGSLFHHLNNAQNTGHHFKNFINNHVAGLLK